MAICGWVIMKKLMRQERSAIYKHLDDFKFEFVLPLASINFYWAELPEGCMGSFYRPDIIKLPRWYYDTAMSPRNTLYVKDMVDLLPTIGHEIIHMRQFIDNPTSYMFLKNRLVAKWTIEPEAIAEGDRIRLIIGRTEHNQKNNG